MRTVEEIRLESRQLYVITRHLYNKKHLSIDEIVTVLNNLGITRNGKSFSRRDAHKTLNDIPIEKQVPIEIKRSALMKLPPELRH